MQKVEFIWHKEQLQLLIYGDYSVKNLTSTEFRCEFYQFVFFLRANEVEIEALLPQQLIITVQQLHDFQVELL